MISVAALYLFTPLDDPSLVQPGLLEVCKANGVKGTLLLAPEGINGTIAGNAEGIAATVDHIRSIEGFEDLDVKYSHADEMPFYRLKVRLKREIVTLGVPGIDPSRDVGRYVEPQDWNELISDPNTIVIDTRNDYEVAIGTFPRAIDPKTTSFREFPAWFREHRESFGENPRIAMFCTGGIRCEKSTAFLRSEGISDVLHLKGGILRYLETVPPEENLWEGECFVFDQRVSVGPGLELGKHHRCHGCRMPLEEKDLNSPNFIEGIQCDYCFGERTPEQIGRYAERQKQITLARQRGEAHLGVDRSSL